MKLARMTCIQCRRALLSPVFLASVCIMAIVLIINSAGLFDESPSVVYLYSSAILRIDFLVICILPILPFGVSYAREYREKSVRFYCIRGGVSRYATSKYIAVILSGFLVVFLGLTVFTLVLSIWFPLISGNSDGGNAFSSLATQNSVFLCLFCNFLSNSLSGALFAGLAYWFSTWYEEQYTVVILPYLLYMVLLLITNIFSLPWNFTATPWFIATPSVQNPLVAILLKLFFVVAVLLLLYYNIIEKVERRILCE